MTVSDTLSKVSESGKRRVLVFVRVNVTARVAVKVRFWVTETLRSCSVVRVSWYVFRVMGREALCDNPSTDVDTFRV